MNLGSKDADAERVKLLIRASEGELMTTRRVSAN